MEQQDDCNQSHIQRTRNPRSERSAKGRCDNLDHLTLHRLRCRNFDNTRAVMREDTPSWWRLECGGFVGVGCELRKSEERFHETLRRTGIITGMKRAINIYRCQGCMRRDVATLAQHHWRRRTTSEWTM